MCRQQRAVDDSKQVVDPTNEKIQFATKPKMTENYVFSAGQSASDSINQCQKNVGRGSTKPMR